MYSIIVSSFPSVSVFSSVTFYSIDEDTIYTFTIEQGTTPTYGVRNYNMLPLVSSADDGKILKVVNGKWTAADA